MGDAGADDAVGSVQVKVSPKAVHNAVRNILVNEMGISRETVLEMLRETVKTTAEAKIQEITLSYLKGNGWDGAQLHERVRKAMERQIDELKPVVKDVARDLVHDAIREDVEGVVEGIVRDGLKVRLGWNRDTRIKVDPAPHSRRTWVPVGDRMPPDGKPVLVYHGNSWNDGKDVGVATYKDGQFRSDRGDIVVKVTHWRSFPDSPAHDED